MINPLSLILSGIGGLSNTSSEGKGTDYNPATPAEGKGTDYNPATLADNNTGGLNDIITIPGPKGSKMTLNQTESDQILKRMQDYLDQRNNNPWNRLEQNVAKGLAIGSGNSDALLNVQKQYQQDAKDTLDMQLQIAQFKAAQENQKAFWEAKKNGSLLGTSLANSNTPPGSTAVGPPNSQFPMGVPPANIQNALNNAQSLDEWKQIYNKWAEEDSQAFSKAKYDNQFNIEWDKKIVAGIRQPDGSIKNQLVSLRELYELQNQNPDKVQYTKDPSNNTQIVNPAGPGSAVQKAAPPPVSHPEFEPIQKTAPATPTQFNPNAPAAAPAPLVKPTAPVAPQSSAAPPPANLAQNTSVFANVKPIMTADASGRVPIGHVDIPPPPSANAPKAAAPVQQLALNTANLPMAPEAVQKEANVPLDIATTRGNEAAKADEADTAQLIKDSKQAQDMLKDLDAYQQHLTKHSHVFGVAQANPITSTIASAENIISGNWHGLSNIIADAELRDPVDKQNLVDARGIAHKIGITFSKANFPGRMTNMELGQSQIAKGLDVNSGVVSNQLALNRAKFAAEQTVKLKDTWDAYKYWMEKDPNNKHHEVASYATFTNTPAYHQIVDAKFPKQEDTFTPIKTSKGHTVEKVSE